MLCVNKCQQWSKVCGELPCRSSSASLAVGESPAQQSSAQDPAQPTAPSFPLPHSPPSLYHPLSISSEALNK